MANPWQVTLTPTGWWEVRYGDGPDDVVSFPPGREREARMCAAAPLLREALPQVLKWALAGLINENHPAAQLAARALADCEPIREGVHHG